MGLVPAPPGWVFLPRGDTFITRTIKLSDRYWEVVRAQPRKGYAETLGVLAPVEAVDHAKRLAEKTVAERAIRRKRATVYRQKAEDRYRQEFAGAILDYLAFAPKHQRLARRIADAAQHATEVGSERIGRTRLLLPRDQG